MVQRRIRANKYMYAQLIDEVDGLCPLCGKKLLDVNASRNFSLSEFAHIYPHSPSNEEKHILYGVPTLSDDPENINNLIALCPNCHTEFDHPRTRDKYMRLYLIKKRIIDIYSAREYYCNHLIEDEVVSVLECIAGNLTVEAPKISYNVTTIDKKMQGKAEPHIITLVKRDVRDYYSAIKQCLADMEKGSPQVSDLIATEIKAFSQKLVCEDIPHEIILDSISEWLDRKTDNKYKHATRILAAFYVQNCEVFTIDLPKQSN